MNDCDDNAASAAEMLGRSTIRHTIVTHGSLAVRTHRLAAARAGAHGRTVTTIGGLACRLAGGFAREIDGETLRQALEAAVPETDLGSLERIKALPGFVDAAAATLGKAWRAGYDLEANIDGKERVAAMARLEAAVLARLPAGMMRPVEIVDAALPRLVHAPAVCGPVRFVGVRDLAKCWQGLVGSLARRVAVTWEAPQGLVPDWLTPDVTVVEHPLAAPDVHVVSAANPRHEAVEAMRWVRALLARGVDAAEIAIGAVAPADYDDHLAVLAADANIPVHFAHGVPVTATREGQAAAALADVLVRGLSQARVRRLARLAPGAFAAAGEECVKILPQALTLRTLEEWRAHVNAVPAEDWPDGIARADALLAVVERLARGFAGAAEAAALLDGEARQIFERALATGPAASVDLTLKSLRRADGLDPCVSVVFAPAGALAAAPRAHVRLLGLASGRWPRPAGEDRLLSDHIVPKLLLDPVPVTVSDRQDFEAIKATAAAELVLSHARRGEDGRRLGRSVLLPAGPEAVLPAARAPAHAFSETDRLTGRPADFAATPQAAAAAACWRNWGSDRITPHDGAVREGHPAIAAILARTQSASSLKLLLTSPLGFVLRYGLGLKAPEEEGESLTLDGLAFGTLIHEILQEASPDLSADGIAASLRTVAARWSARTDLPPHVIWQRTLERARDAATTACAIAPLAPGARTFAEVPFGDRDEDTGGRELPWTPGAPVAIPGTPFRLEGKIDRLDIVGNGTIHVWDFKAGRALGEAAELDGGAELQRSVYAFAVRAMLGEETDVRPALVYPRECVVRPLENPGATLATLAAHLAAAAEALSARGGTVGPATGGTYDDLAFALPASATYMSRKTAAAGAWFGPAAEIWEAA